MTTSIAALPLTRKRSLLIAGFFILLFGFVFAYFVGIGHRIPFTSDAAAIVLEARSVLQGNLLLKGWILSTVSFYTTELPLYVGGLPLLGVSDTLVYWATAFQYALLVSATVYLSSIDDEGAFSFRRAFVAVIFSSFLASQFHVWKDFSPVHLMALFYSLGCLLCISQIQRGKGWGFYLLYWFFLFLASAGDSFAILIVGLPVVAVCIFRLFSPGPKRKYLLLILVTGLAILASRACLAGIKAAGGFFLPSVAVGLAPLRFLGTTLSYTFIGLFDLFGINLLTPHQPALGILASGLHALGLIVFIAALLQGLRKFKSQPLVVQITLTLIVTNFLAYGFGNMAYARSTVRYLMPSLVFGILLMTRNITGSVELSRHWRLVSVVLVALGLSLVQPASIAPAEVPVAPLAAFLAQNHLTNGYGPFWSSHVTTIHTGGKISVHPVMGDANGRIGPFHWLSETGEYDRTANFLVLDRDPDEDMYSISLQTATSTFGNPDRILPVDDRFTVLVWDHNISLQLAPGTSFWEITR